MTGLAYWRAADATLAVASGIFSADRRHITTGDNDAVEEALTILRGSQSLRLSFDASNSDGPSSSMTCLILMSWREHTKDGDDVGTV